MLLQVDLLLRDLNLIASTKTPLIPQKCNSPGLSEGCHSAHYRLLYEAARSWSSDPHERQKPSIPSASWAEGRLGEDLSSDHMGILEVWAPSGLLLRAGWTIL